MESKFEFGQLDGLLEKANADASGDIRDLMGEVIRVSKKAAKLGVSMEELASLATMGWYIGADPEIENTFNLLMMNLIGEASMGDQVN